jgi:hypothetical protein
MYIDVSLEARSPTEATYISFLALFSITLCSMLGAWMTNGRLEDVAAANY